MHVLVGHHHKSIARPNFACVQDRQANACIFFAKFTKFLADGDRSDLLQVVVLSVHSLRLRSRPTGARNRNEQRVADLRPEMRVHQVVEAR